MSKNKKKKSASKQPVKKKSNKKNIAVFSAVAVFFAVLIILSITVFIPAYNNHKAENPDREVKFNGGEIPASFKTIIEQAKKDSKVACEKTGIAMTVGDYKISVAELEMAYYDVYTQYHNEAYEYVLNHGYNPSQFPFSKLPEEAKHPDGGMWSEFLLNKAKDNIRRYYYLFDKAVKDGYMPSDMEIQEITDGYEYIKGYESFYDGGISAMLSDSYNDSVTYDMYCALYIKREYASKYEEKVKSYLSTKASDSEIKNHIKGKEVSYQRFLGRIYPMNKDVKGFEGLKTEQEFLSFCNNNSSDKSYDAKTLTDFSYSSYADIEQSFYAGLADYVFSSDRKNGEISVFEGNTYNFLIYIEKKAYIECSADLIIYYQEYSSTDEDTIESEKSSLTDTYNEWIKSGAKENELMLICNYNSSGGELPYGQTTMRTGSFHRDIDAWCRDGARKEGDYAKFELDNMFVIVYFKHLNKADTDDIYLARNEIAQEKFESDYLPSDSDFPMVTDEAKVKDIPAMADSSINRLKEKREGR